MFRIACTTATGFLPMALSSLSITASVPSNTAFATSLISALVAVSCSAILSIICVAVMTGFEASLAFLMMSFWIVGTL